MDKELLRVFEAHDTSCPLIATYGSSEGGVGTRFLGETNAIVSGSKIPDTEPFRATHCSQTVGDSRKSGRNVLGEGVNALKVLDTS